MAKKDDGLTPEERLLLGETPEEGRLHPILSDEEYREALSLARSRVDADRKKAAREAVVKVEIERLKLEEGLTTGGGVNDEIVQITLDLAEHSSSIVLNWQAYWHGVTYKVPRHVANSLREIQERGWRHQNEIDGKSLTQFYQRPRDTVLSAVKGVSNSPNNVAAA